MVDRGSRGVDTRGVGRDAPSDRKAAMLPTDVPTPSDVFDSAPGCPSCESQWGHPETSHGAPGDRSLSGLLCSVAQAQRLLNGDDPDFPGVRLEGDEISDLLGQALARFRGEA